MFDLQVFQSDPFSDVLRFLAHYPYVIVLAHDVGEGERLLCLSFLTLACQLLF